MFIQRHKNWDHLEDAMFPFDSAGRRFFLSGPNFYDVE